MPKFKTVLITGGTDGLGRALAVRYLRSGSRVIVLGRTDRRGVDDADAIFMPCDPAEPESTARIARELAHANILALDCLIHCAGIGWVGDHGTQPGASIDVMVAVNTWAPIALTR